MLARVPTQDHPSFSAWRTATQRYQSDLLRHHIETLRRLKYRPTGGFCFSWLADPGPMISASVLDDERQPKDAWRAVTEACRPVIVVSDPLPAVLPVHHPLRLDVHVVNDLREPVAALVSATASWRGGHRQWGFRGTIGGDACELVGTLEFAAPERPGELLLGIALTGRTDSGRAISATRRAGARVV